MENIKVEYLSVDELIPYVNNARTHSKDQVLQIMSSIKEFGFVNPVLIGEDNVIIAGHGRLLAAQKLNMEKLPVIKLSHLSEAQRKALILADNKLAENAGWDEELLRIELKALDELDFDLDVIGFDGSELDDLLNFEEDDDEEEEEEIPEVQEETISKPGDIWICGEHKVICGDACIENDYQKLLGDELVDMIFTDPPYNVNYGATQKDALGYHSSKNAKPIMNDNLGEGFEQFLYDSFINMMMYNKGAFYVCMSSSELDVLQKAFRKAGGKWSTFIIWAKNTFTLSRSDYQRQYEPILYGWKDGIDKYWCGARNQGDVWFYNKPVKNDLHPTMKPVELVERAIKNSSKNKDIVLDCFGGSGSTMIACEKLNRRARLIELDPKYVDVIVKRWENFTGEKAELYQGE